MAVNVKFGASTDDLESGIERAKSSVQSFLAPVNDLSGSFNNLTDATGSVSDALGVLGSGAAIGGILGLLGFVGKTNQEMLDLQKNAKEVGLSLDKFQEVKYAASLGGVNDQQFLSGLQTASGKLNELLHSTSDLSKFLDANNVKYKLANGELISTDQYLQVAARLVQNAATEGDKFKAAALLGFSRDWVSVLERGPAAMRATESAAHDVGAVLDKELVQRDAEFARRWNETALQWASGLKQAIISVTPYVNALVDSMKGGFAELQKIVSGEATKNLAASDKDALNRNVLAAMGVLPAQVEAPAHAALPGANDAFGSLNTDVSKSPASGVPGGGAGSGAATSFPAAADKDAARAAIEAMQGEIQEAQRVYQIEIEQLNAALAAHRITEQEKTASTTAAVNQRQTSEERAIDTVMARSDLSQAQTQKIENEKTAIVQKAMLDRVKITEEESQKAVQDWNAALAPLQSAFDSQLRGLLAGTTSWAQAMKSIFSDLVLDIIKGFEKIALEKLATSLASAFGDPAAMFAGAAKAITASMGQMYAGEAAFFAPLLGPGAPAAAAAVVATTEATALGMSGVGSFAIGGYVTASGVGMIHAGETILPAQVSTPYQGGGGGGGSGINLNVSAVDGASVQKFFQQYGRQIATTLAPHLAQPSYQNA